MESAQPLHQSVVPSDASGDAGLGWPSRHPVRGRLPNLQARDLRTESEGMRDKTERNVLDLLFLHSMNIISQNEAVLLTQITSLSLNDCSAIVAQLSSDGVSDRLLCCPMQSPINRIRIDTLEIM